MTTGVQVEEISAHKGRTLHLLPVLRVARDGPDLRPLLGYVVRNLSRAETALGATVFARTRQDAELGSGLVVTLDWSALQQGSLTTGTDGTVYQPLPLLQFVWLAFRVENDPLAFAKLLCEGGLQLAPRL